MKPRANFYKIDRIAYQEPVDPAWYWDRMRLVAWGVLVLLASAVFVICAPS